TTPQPTQTTAAKTPPAQQHHPHQTHSSHTPNQHTNTPTTQPTPRPNPPPHPPLPLPRPALRLRPRLALPFRFSGRFHRTPRHTRFRRLHRATFTTKHRRPRRGRHPALHISTQQRHRQHKPTIYPRIIRILLPTIHITSNQ